MLRVDHEVHMITLVGREGCAAGGGTYLEYCCMWTQIMERVQTNCLAGSCNRLGGTIPESHSFVWSVHLLWDDIWRWSGVSCQAWFLVTRKNVRQTPCHGTFSSPNSVPHLQYYFLTYLAICQPYILHLKYNSWCILLCSNSNPALIHYVIPLHFITLTSSLFMTSHPHSHWYCCALI